MSSDITLMLVDDDELSLEYFRGIFQQFDYRFLVADSAASAKELFNNKSVPDIVITDLVMGDESGIDLMSWIKESYPHIPVAVSTGFASKETAIKALKLGAFDYFEKSDRFEKITTSLNNAANSILRNRELETLKQKAKKIDQLAIVGTMTSTIVHDLKNPLFNIDINIKKAISKIDTKPEEAKEALKKAEATVAHTFDLIKSQLSLIKGNQPQFFKSKVKKIVDDAASLSTPSLLSLGIKLNSQIEDKNLELNCHKIQIVQALSNMITNSIHAIKDFEERWIKVIVKESENRLGFHVIDSGPGIPPELQNKIFQSLFTTKSEGDGTGLGLGIVKRIAEEHGGRFYLDTTSKNTEFVLSIPK